MSIEQRFAAVLEDPYAPAFDALADQRGIFSDSTALALEMESRMDEITRLCDVVDTLQDTVASVEGLKAADPHHLMLLEACLNMAQVGTPKTAADIQPSLESYLGTTISTEGVGDTISKVIAKIMRLLRELWHMVQDFFQRVLGEVARARLRMSYVRTLVNEIDGKNPIRNTVSLGSSIVGVGTEQGVPHNASTVIISLNELLHQTQFMRMHVVPLLVAVGQGFVNTMPKWPDNPEQNDQWLMELNTIASAFKPHEIAHAMGKAWPTHNPTVPHGAGLVTGALPGMRSLCFIAGEYVYPEQAKSGSAMDQAMVLQANNIGLMRLRPASNLDISKLTMEVVNNNELAHILDVVEKVLDETQQNITGGLRTKLDKLGRQINEAVAKIHTGEVDKARLQRGVRYSLAFTRWVRSSYVDLMAHDLMVSRAMMSFVAHHCSAYHA